MADFQFYEPCMKTSQSGSWKYSRTSKLAGGSQLDPHRMDIRPAQEWPENDARTTTCPSARGSSSTLNW